MRWESWRPLYEGIVSDLGYDIDEDHRVAMLLASKEPPRGWATIGVLKERISRTAVIIGNAASLETELSLGLPEGTVIAAGSSIRAVMLAGIVPDVHVTDLDGDGRSHIEANAMGCLTMVHAHGDNENLIETMVPALEGDVIPTTQGRPFDRLVNMGGLTDGDRAFCVAVEMGAREIHLMGFDFDRPNCEGSTRTEMKSRKLAWARRIIDVQSRSMGVRTHMVDRSRPIPDIMS